MTTRRIALTTALIVAASTAIACGGTEGKTYQAVEGLPSTDVDYAAHPTTAINDVGRAGPVEAIAPRPSDTAPTPSLSVKRRAGAMSICAGDATIAAKKTWAADLSGDFTLAFTMRAMTSDRVVVDAGRLQVRIEKGRLEVIWGSDRLVGPEINDWAEHHVLVARYASGVVLFWDHAAYVSKRFTAFGLTGADWPPANVRLGSKKPAGCVIVDNVTLMRGAPAAVKLQPSADGVWLGAHTVFAFDFDGDATDRGTGGHTMALTGFARHIFID